MTDKPIETLPEPVGSQVDAFLDDPGPRPRRSRASGPTQTSTYRLPTPLYERLRQEAFGRRVSQNLIIEEALRLLFAKQDMLADVQQYLPESATGERREEDRD